MADLSAPLRGREGISLVGQFLSRSTIFRTRQSIRELALEASLGGPAIFRKNNAGPPPPLPVDASGRPLEEATASVSPQQPSSDGVTLVDDASSSSGGEILVDDAASDEEIASRFVEDLSPAPVEEDDASSEGSIEPERPSRRVKGLLGKIKNKGRRSRGNSLQLHAVRACTAGRHACLTCD